jgi:hypothetical protein
MGSLENTICAVLSQVGSAVRELPYLSPMRKCVACLTEGDGSGALRALEEVPDGLRSRIVNRLTESFQASTPEILERLTQDELLRLIHFGLVPESIPSSVITPPICEALIKSQLDGEVTVAGFIPCVLWDPGLASPSFKTLLEARIESSQEPPIAHALAKTLFDLAFIMGAKVEFPPAPVQRRLYREIVSDKKTASEIGTNLTADETRYVLSALYYCPPTADTLLERLLHIVVASPSVTKALDGIGPNKVQLLGKHLSTHRNQGLISEDAFRELILSHPGFIISVADCGTNAVSPTVAEVTRILDKFTENPEYRRFLFGEHSPLFLRAIPPVERTSLDYLHACKGLLFPEKQLLAREALQILQEMPQRDIPGFLSFLEGRHDEEVDTLLKELPRISSFIPYLAESKILLHRIVHGNPNSIESLPLALRQTAVDAWFLISIDNLNNSVSQQSTVSPNSKGVPRSTVSGSGSLPFEIIPRQMLRSVLPQVSNKAFENALNVCTSTAFQELMFFSPNEWRPDDALKMVIARRGVSLDAADSIPWIREDISTSLDQRILKDFPELLLQVQDVAWTTNHYAAALEGIALEPHAPSLTKLQRDILAFIPGSEVRAWLVGPPDKMIPALMSLIAHDETLRHVLSDEWKNGLAVVARKASELIPLLPLSHPEIVPHDQRNAFAHNILLNSPENLILDHLYALAIWSDPNSKLQEIADVFHPLSDSFRANCACLSIKCGTDSSQRSARAYVERVHSEGLPFLVAFLNDAMQGNEGANEVLNVLGAKLITFLVDSSVSSDYPTFIPNISSPAIQHNFPDILSALQRAGEDPRLDLTSNNSFSILYKECVTAVVASNHGDLGPLFLQANNKVSTTLPTLVLQCGTSERIAEGIRCGWFPLETLVNHLSVDRENKQKGMIAYLRLCNEGSLESLFSSQDIVNALLETDIVLRVNDVPLKIEPPHKVPQEGKTENLDISHLPPECFEVLLRQISSDNLTKVLKFLAANKPDVFSSDLLSSGFVGEFIQSLPDNFNEFSAAEVELTESQRERFLVHILETVSPASFINSAKWLWYNGFLEPPSLFFLKRADGTIESTNFIKAADNIRDILTCCGEEFCSPFLAEITKNGVEALFTPEEVQGFPSSGLTALRLAALPHLLETPRLFVQTDQWLSSLDLSKSLCRRFIDFALYVETVMKTYPSHSKELDPTAAQLLTHINDLTVHSDVIGELFRKASSETLPSLYPYVLWVVEQANRDTLSSIFSVLFPSHPELAVDVCTQVLDSLNDNTSEICSALLVTPEVPNEVVKSLVCPLILSSIAGSTYGQFSTTPPPGLIPLDRLANSKSAIILQRKGIFLEDEQRRISQHPQGDRLRGYANLSDAISKSPLASLLLTWGDLDPQEIKKDVISSYLGLPTFVGKWFEDVSALEIDNIIATQELPEIASSIVGKALSTNMGQSTLAELLSLAAKGFFAHVPMPIVIPKNYYDIPDGYLTFNEDLDSLSLGMMIASQLFQEKCGASPPESNRYVRDLNPSTAQLFLLSFADRLVALSTSHSMLMALCSELAAQISCRYND